MQAPTAGKDSRGSSLAVQWLGLMLSLPRAQVRSLDWDLEPGLSGPGVCTLATLHRYFHRGSRGSQDGNVPQYLYVCQCKNKA